ncbi:hypothetical protein NIES2101_09400 [Calothrix sp. HK-06]|nr:hypothetical protein NIES2101_09400 [Calothrix sp. HK-06]
MPSQNSEKEPSDTKKVKSKPAYIMTEQGMQKIEKICKILFKKGDPSNAKLSKCLDDKLHVRTISKIMNRQKGVNEKTINMLFENFQKYYDDNKYTQDFKYEGVKIEDKAFYEIVQLKPNDYKQLIREQASKNNKNPTAQYKDINDTISSSINNKDYPTLNKYLLSLNCEDQKKSFSEKIKNRTGFFIIQADKHEILPWFRYVLEQNIGGLQTAKKIPIQIDNVMLETNFDNVFIQKITKDKTVKNPDREAVITNLADYYKTKTVIFYISCPSSFTFKGLDKLYTFYSDLIQNPKIRDSLAKHNQQGMPKYLIFFLMGKLNNNVSIDNQNMTLLSLDEISSEELYKWIIYLENQNDSQKALNINQDTYENIKKFTTEPYAVITNIFKYVFGLDEHDETIKDYWKLEQG